MPKSIALGLLGAGVILLAILLAGCTGAPSPTTSAWAVPTPAATAQPGATPVPTPAPKSAPADTPTPEPTPPALTLDEYLSQCAPEEADVATYGDFSALN